MRDPVTASPEATEVLVRLVRVSRWVRAPYRAVVPRPC